MYDAVSVFCVCECKGNTKIRHMQIYADFLLNKWIKLLYLLSIALTIPFNGLNVRL